jgi:hypothetical protein
MKPLKNLRNFKISVLDTINNKVLAIWYRQAETLEVLEAQLAAEHWNHPLVIETTLY